MSKRIAVVGASGKTGRFVVEALGSHSEMSLGAAIVSPSSALIGREVPSTGVCYSGDISEIGTCDGVIDFSTPEVSLDVARLSASRKLPLLIATTGHSKDCASELRACGEHMPCLIASNTSISAAVLGLVAEYAQQLLGDSFDIEVMEIHHKQKRDAPSGTAATVVSGLSQPDHPVVFGRSGLRKHGEIGVVSLRGGDVVGEHTVYFLGQSERIEVTQRATDRRVFGQGAVRLMEGLLHRPPGVCGVRDVLALTQRNP